MDRSSSTRLPGRLVPAAGGHVPVRVRGFVEAAAGRHLDHALQTFAVGLARTDHGVVKVIDGATVLGYLPEAWSQAVDFELWSCEQAGEPALARAVLEGQAGERELYVLLAWRRGSRPV
ncbi:hypothetical protein IC607_03350 [Cellulomonas sp. JH27-2]|uniref:hypothetical protein n=1 Tax=Cellulomonas sp. JH27-2 TaxID=2774139 RepID=UPI0017853BB0|nr:hypothetical protein [Cellulomonas sp. JH27-2]MBD8058001.1 hypothetical protein [Cellulomonas sp. JH27-2]